MDTMFRILELVTPELVEGLVPSASMERIRRLAQELPLVSKSGLECHLASPIGRTDFALCFLPRERERRLLSSMSGRVRAFAERCWHWPLSLAVRDIWLEFDLPEELIEIPTPSVFVGINYADDAEFTSTIDACATSLRGAQENEHIMRSLLRCIRSSQTTQGYYLGIFAARPNQATRLSLSLPAASVAEYLKSIAWPGPMILSGQSSMV